MMFYRTFLFCAILPVFSLTDESKVPVTYGLDDKSLRSITFHLNTRNNPDKSLMISKDVDSLKNSTFDFSKPVKIILHGFRGNYNDRGNFYLRSGFLIAQDCNIISVNWQEAASGEYEDVVRRVPQVSMYITSFIDWLNSEGVPFENFHLVGFSMGGQLSGFIGRSLKRGRLNYITVLDPANKYWEVRDDRINKGDGNYVEVIHTDTNFMGLKFPAGHADFYPNGGKMMVGCNGEDFCSHLRSCQYFAETLGYGTGSGIFTGQRCATYDDMKTGECANLGTAAMGGIHVKNISGIYYLRTNEESPYSQG